MSNSTNIANIKIMCWNAQSIMSKLYEFIDFIHNHSTDIIVLTETWLNSSKNLSIPNYEIYRMDRQDGEHGGVAIIIKENIKHEILPSLNTTAIENISIKITTQNLYFTITAAYFPGTNLSAQNLNNFKKDLQTLTSVNHSFFVCGDFNAKHTLWNNFRCNRAGKILYTEITKLLKLIPLK